MANEFVVRKGLISSGSVVVSGSLTASFFKGDGSQLTNVIPANVVSSSTQVTVFLPTGTVSSSGQVSYTGLSGVSSGIVSSSTQVSTLLPTGTVSSSTQVVASLPTNIVSSSTQFTSLTAPFTGSFTGSFTGTLPYSGLTGTPTLLSSSAQLPSGTVSSSGQVSYTGLSGVSSGIISSSTQLPTGTVSASAQVSYTGLSSIPSDIVSSSTQVTPLLPTGTVSSSTQATTWTVATSSYSITASYAMNGGGGGAVPAGTVSSSAQFQTLANPFTGSFTGSFVGNGSLLTGLNVSTALNVDVYKFVGDASTTVFTVSSSYYPTSVFVSVDGISLINPEDYSISGSGITFVNAPPSESNISIRAFINAQSSATGSFTGSFRGDGSLLTGTNVPAGTVSSSTQFSSLTAPFTGSFTGSHTGTFPYGGLTSIPAGIFSSSAQLPTGTVSSSGQVSYSGLTSIPLGIVSSSTQVTPLLPSGTVSSSGQVSYTGLSNIPSGIVSSSTQVAPLLPTGTVSSSTQVVASLPANTISSSAQFTSLTTPFTGSFTGSFSGTLPFSGLTSVPTLVSSSTQVSYTGLTGVPAGIVSSSAQVTPLLPTGTVSSSGQVSYTGLSSIPVGIVSSSAQFTSLTAPFTGSFTGSYTGTFPYGSLTSIPAGIFSSSVQLPSGTVSGSGQVDYNSITNKLSGVVSSSAQVSPLLPGGTVSASAQINTGSFSGSITSASYVVASGLPSGTVSASGQVDYNSITNKLSGVVSASTQVAPLLPGGTVSSSAQINTGSFSGSITSASYVVASGLPAGTVSSSGQVDYNSITNKLSGVVSSSAQVTLLLPAGTVSSSIQIAASVPAGTVSSSTQFKTLTDSFSGSFSGSYTGTFPYTSLTSIPAGIFSSSVQLPSGTVSGSGQVDYNSITNKLSGVVSSSAQVTPLLPVGTVSSSTQLPSGTVSSSGQVALASITGTTFGATNFTFPQNLLVTGTVTAREIYTQYVSSSVIFESGSSKFGDTSDDVMSVTGSIRVLGGTISGSMVGMFSGSAQVDYNSITNKLSGVVSSSAQVAPLLPGDTVSSSAQVVAGVAAQTIAPSIINATGAISGASIQTSGNGIIGGTLAVTGAATFSSTLAISGALTGVTTLTASSTATIGAATSPLLLDRLADATNYGAMSFNASLTSTTMNGLFGRLSATDGGLYITAPSGSSTKVQVAGSTVATFAGALTTLATPLAITGALTGVTTGAFSGQVTLSATDSALQRFGNTTNACYQEWRNTSGYLQMGVERSIGGGLITGSTGYAGCLTTVGTVLQLGGNQSLALTLTGTAAQFAGTLGVTGASTLTGNVGVGAAPLSAVANFFKLNVGTNMSMFANSGVNSVGLLMQNANYDGANYVRINTDLASRYYQALGVQTFSHAVTGIAGSTITWVDDFVISATGAATFGNSLAISGAFTGATTGAFSSTVTLQASIAFAASAGQSAGSIAKNATYGLTYYGVAGSSYDFALLNSNGSLVAYNATGTQNIAFAGTLAVSGAATFSSTLAVTGQTTFGLNQYVHFPNTDNTNEVYCRNEGVSGANNAALVWSMTNLGEALRLSYTAGGPGKLLVTGTLAVTGAATFSDTLDVAGDVVVTKAQNATTLVRILNTNAGASAFASLLMDNDQRANNLTLRSYSGAAGSSIPDISDSVLLRANGAGGLTLSAQHASGIIRFSTGGVTERVRIDATGNVGIGTTSPYVKLDVSGTTAAPSALSANPITSGTLVLSDATHTVGAVMGTAANGGNYDTYIQARHLTSGNVAYNLLLQPLGGNVGIGTVTPGYKLEISTDSAGKPGTGGLWTVVSDARIKTDIVPADLNRCYEIVKSVPLKHFGFASGVYTDDQIQDKHNLGWIAQDVQKVFKNAVSVKPFTLKTDIPDGVEDYEEQDFTLETVNKTETSIQVIDGKAVQVSRVVTSENKVLLFDTVDVLDEAGDAVMEGDKPLTYQMPRMITKTRPKVRRDVIEDCLDLNGGQMIAALYGAVQAIMDKGEALTARVAALEGV